MAVSWLYRQLNNRTGQVCVYVCVYVCVRGGLVTSRCVYSIYVLFALRVEKEHVVGRSSEEQVLLDSLPYSCYYLFCPISVICN